MKKVLLLLAFSICQNILAQESSLILKFYGFSDDPLKLAFILACTKEDNSEERVLTATNYYIQNKDSILYLYDAALYVQYLERLIQHQNEQFQATLQGIQTFSEIISQATISIKEGIERDKQREQELKMQKRAEHEAMVANSPDRRPSRQATSNYKIQNSGISNSAYRTQGSYNDLLTSDPNWNQQVQMWVQQYGVEKTREIVRQQRSNDTSQQAEIDNTYKSYNERVSQSSGQERIVTGVTENGQTIQLKIKGGNIVAYSTGLNYYQQQNWSTVYMVSYNSCSMSGAAFLDHNLSKQYAYYASINNMRVYFNL